MAPTPHSKQNRHHQRIFDPNIQYSEYLSPRNLIFTAEELRQFLFCPRIPVFRHIRKYNPKGTYLMERGTELHEKVLYADQNDKIAKMIRKNIIPLQADTEQFHDIYLESASLHLAARFDLYEKTGEEYYPVEIKTGPIPKKNRSMHHYIQLAVQARLLEEIFHTAVTRARIVYVESGENLWIDMNIDLKNRLNRAIEQLTQSLMDEDLPAPTHHQAKCQTCEYFPLCRGI